MSVFAERRRIELEQKIGSLDTEFGIWIDNSREKRFYEKHQTQIVAVSGQLRGLRARVSEEFESSIKAGQLLAEARNIESLVLAVRRIWEFFRAKWVQRREDQFSLFLRAADELAWSCYQPVLGYREREDSAARRREPPLVFLNGGTSPFAIARDLEFEPEPVAQEFLTGKEFASVLEHLPIPVIGVPWFHLAHVAESTVVAHETGHAVERDFALLNGLVANMKKVVPTERQAAWTSWMREAFADVFACLTMGPAYAGTLMEFLAVDPAAVAQEKLDPTGKYPSVRIRVALCMAALVVTGFVADTRMLLRRWYRAYGMRRTSAFETDAMEVVRALICESAAPLHLALFEIPGLRVTFRDYEDAAVGMKQRLAKPPAPPYAVNNIRSFFILARLLYDKDPAKFFATKQTEALLNYLPGILRPGVRAGEERLSDPALKQLELAYKEKGESWFDELRELVVPHKGSTDSDRDQPTA